MIYFRLYLYIQVIFHAPLNKIFKLTFNIERNQCGRKLSGVSKEKLFIQMCIYTQNENQIGHRTKQVLPVDYNFNFKLSNSLKIVHKREKCFADFKSMTYEHLHNYIFLLIRIRKQFKRKKRAVITFFFDGVTHSICVSKISLLFLYTTSTFPLGQEIYFSQCVVIYQEYCCCSVNIK